MLSDIIQRAYAFRQKIEELAGLAAPSMDDEKKVEFIKYFPNFDPNNEGYGLQDVVFFDGHLYENLLNGNKMSPAEYSYAWRKIDPEATNLEEI